MKLGIGTYTFMWSIGFPEAEPASPMTAMDLLGKARSLGVKVAQFGPNLSLAKLAEEDLLSLISQAKTWEITIEIGTQGLSAGNLYRHVTLAKQVGARLIRTTTEGEDGITPTMHEMLACIQAILPELAANEITLAIENGRLPACELADLSRAAASPWVGVTLDSVNSLAIPEGPAYVTETLLPHIRSVHVKDFNVERVWHRMGFSVQGRPAGQGQLNVPEFLSKLAGADRSINFILELWPPEQASLEETIQLENVWAADSISYLRRYITD